MNRFWIIEEQFMNYLLKNFKDGSVIWRVLFECVKRADWDPPHKFKTSYNGLAKSLGRKKKVRFVKSRGRECELYSTSDIARAVKRLSKLGIISSKPIYGQNSGIIQYFEYEFKAMYYDRAITLGWRK